jgi:hypothetical protein
VIVFFSTSSNVSRNLTLVMDKKVSSMIATTLWAAAPRIHPIPSALNLIHSQLHQYVENI